MTSQELDEIRASGEGMYDRREDEHHPVNTDPPCDAPRCRDGEEYGDGVHYGPCSTCGGTGKKQSPTAGAVALQCADDAISLASQDEADSGTEEDTRQARNFNALSAREEDYMALARSCSRGTLRQHCADYGMRSPEPERLRWLAGRCFILARRIEMERES